MKVRPILTSLSSRLLEPQLGLDPIGGGGKLLIHTCDIHYQSTNIGTKNKVPDFWA